MDSPENAGKKLCPGNIFIPLANDEKHAITQWILKGVTRGYIAGPFDPSHEFGFNLHLSPLFVVRQPNKLRPVAHLSYSKNGTVSVNELVREAEKSVQYINFRELVTLIHAAGEGAYLFIVDAEDAYYRVPIKQSMIKYMGLKWCKKLWIFLSLQMGLASACKIYTRFADAIEYIVVRKNQKYAFKNGIQLIRHYIDDFFGCHPDKETAKLLYKQLIKWFRRLGVPTRPDKCHPPNTEQTILGWLFDTVSQMASLPDDKRTHILKMIANILSNGIVDLKLLEKIVGKLQHAATLIFPGKAFVRRLEVAMYCLKLNYGEKIILSEFILEDLRWWQQTLSLKQTVSQSFDWILRNPDSADFTIYTDAATRHGVGGWMGTQCFQIRWEDTRLHELVAQRKKYISDTEEAVDIFFEEYLGSVTAVLLWAPLLVNKTVTIFNDNPGAAAAMIRKAPPLHRLDCQYLTRLLCQTAVKFNFKFWAVHLDGKHNKLADALSRFLPVDFEKEKLQLVPCKTIVNQVISNVMKQPRNLDAKITIPDKVYSLLKIGKIHKKQNGALVQSHTQEKNLFTRSLHNILARKSIN